MYSLLGFVLLPWLIQTICYIYIAVLVPDPYCLPFNHGYWQSCIDFFSPLFSYSFIAIPYCPIKLNGIGSLVQLISLAFVSFADKLEFSRSGFVFFVLHIRHISHFKKESVNKVYQVILGKHGTPIHISYAEMQQVRQSKKGGRYDLLFKIKAMEFALGIKYMVHRSAVKIKGV